MARNKIDYGIDLGTTNSAIARMESGNPKVQKVDLSMDTLPSCVAFSQNRKGVKSIEVGIPAINRLYSAIEAAISKGQQIEECGYLEFKREMGGDKTYSNEKMPKDLYTPEELSSELLKKLKSYISDEEINSVVITVPAKFTRNQKDATIRAAKLAGFQQCELLQEPIAASMAYGLTAKEKNGIWMVFDFGGGTFDAALVKVEDGIMQIFDTEGDNYLGGKNLDEAVISKILIPHLQKEYNLEFDYEWKMLNLKALLKKAAEDIRISLSRDNEFVYSSYDSHKDFGKDADGASIELEITVSREDLECVIRPIYQKAVDICKELLKKNNLSDSQIKLLLVGGPTYSPIIRDMLKVQVTSNVDVSVDPMTVVAQGAALYASTLDCKVEKKTDIGEVVFDVMYESTSVETVEYVSMKIDKTKCNGDIPETLYVELIRGDEAWASGKTNIDDVGDVIEVVLAENKPNAFKITAFDDKGNTVKCSPSEITIIQGTKVGSAVLPYNISLERWDEKKGAGVMKCFKGLDKNRPYPATGVANGLKTTNDLRPGTDDYIRIPIYESDNDSEGLRAVYYERVYEFRINGNDVPAFIPEGSDVDLTLKVTDNQWELKAFFPCIGEEVPVKLDTTTVQKSVTDEYLQNEINKAEVTLKRLSNEGSDVKEEKNQLNSVKEEHRGGSQQKQVLQHLKEVCRKLDRMESEGEWARVERKLRSEFDMLEEDNNKYGNEKTTRIVEDFRSKVDDCIRIKDPKLGKELIDAMHNFDYQIAQVEYFIIWVLNWERNFNTVAWNDRNRARQLLDRALTIVNDNPSTETLNPIVGQLIRLLPKNQLPEGAEGLLI